MLLNLRVIEESPQTDEQHEGCLSFFDVRGMIPRLWSCTSSIRPSTASGT
jgi:peptide deformylase